MWVLDSTDGSVATQTCRDRFVNIPRRRVVELLSCRLEQQLLPMCQHGLPWRATLKRHPMSGKGGKLETIAHLPAAGLAPKSAQGRIRSRVRRRNPRYHMHLGLVRYLQISTMNSYRMSASSNETVWLDIWIIKAIPTTFVRSSSSRTYPIGANSSCCRRTSDYGCHKGTVNWPGTTWTFWWWRHGGGWESRRYVHAIKAIGLAHIIISLTNNRSTGCRYSLAAWIFYESTGWFQVVCLWWWFYWLLEILD